jgi:hypothetical protein
VVEAILLFALLFAVVSDGRPLLALGVIVGVVVLCVVALRLIGIETYRWLPERTALLVLVGVNVLGLLVLVTR